MSVRHDSSESCRLSRVTRVAVLLAVIEAVFVVGLQVWFAVGTAQDGLRDHRPWIKYALFEVALGLGIAAIGVVPLLSVVLWAGRWATPRSTHGEVAVLVGVVVHVVFTIWLTIDIAFPPTFRGATFGPFWLLTGQIAVVTITWLAARAARANPLSSFPGPTFR